MSTINPPQVLVVDDEPNLRRVLSAQLERLGYEVQTATHGREALELLSTDHIDVMISDLKMPEMDGMELLREVTENYRGMPLIMMTAHGTVDTAVEALKLGAFDYVTKPFDKDDLARVVAKAIKTQAAAKSAPTPDAGSALIGESEAWKQVEAVIDKVAASSSTVLVRGESGTGKELVARALHERSERATKPFVRLNSAAIPEGLVESELFGYEKGAFTGATTSKPGKFELADGGTLFLDEIGEIPPSTQAKLLRVLQERELIRVGGVRSIPVDVRLVTATNRDLRDEVEQGNFREDLFYRINVVDIFLPPLRERRADIPLFLNHFIDRFTRRLGTEVEGISEEALGLLMSYDWPGNIRELENVIERCILFAESSLVQVADLPQEIVGVDAETSEDESAGGLKDLVRHATAQLEREFIVRALRKTNGNVTRTAQILKISRRSLQTKMKELGLR